MVLLLSPLVMLGVQQSIFREVVPNPTLKNGYEEYVRAAEIASSPRVRAILQWEPGRDYSDFKPTGESEEERRRELLINQTLRGLAGKTPLQVKRQLLGDYKGVLDLVRQGNLKPVVQPRKSIDLYTTFPEFAGLRSASRLATQCSDALLANGQSAEAARVLTDFLDMSTNLPQDTLISNLVGIGCETVVLNGFFRQLDRFSEVDWRFIADRCSAILGKPLELDKTLERDTEASLQALDDYIANKDKDKLRSMFELQGADSVMSRIEKMTTLELQDLRKRLAFDFKRSISLLSSLLKGPESKWRYIATEGNPDTEWITFHLLPSYDQVMVANARIRTQLRLLRLHALIQIYRWHWGELPADFSSFGAADTFDPLSESRFQMERSDGGYRLFSKGNSATGEIELRYQRASSDRKNLPPMAFTALPSRAPSSFLPRVDGR